MLARGQALEADCQALQAAIAEALAEPGSATPKPGPRVDLAQLNSVVSQLDALLAADEMAASDFFYENEALLGQAFGKRAARIKQQIDDYSYDLALAELRAAFAAMSGSN